MQKKETSFAIRHTPNLNCWQRAPTRSGWDITKLKGPAKWTYYYLYVIIDIFSRYIVGWMVAYREQGILAKKLIE